MGLNWENISLKTDNDSLISAQGSETDNLWAQTHLKQMKEAGQRIMIISGKSVSERTAMTDNIACLLRADGYAYMELFADGFADGDDAGARKVLEKIYDSAKTAKTALIIYSISKAEDAYQSQLIAYAAEMIIADSADTVIIVDDPEYEKIPERILDKAYACTPRTCGTNEILESVRSAVSPYEAEDTIEKYAGHFSRPQAAVFASAVKAYMKSGHEMDNAHIPEAVLKKARADVLNLIPHTGNETANPDINGNSTVPGAFADPVSDKPLISSKQNTHSDNPLAGMLNGSEQDMMGNAEEAINELKGWSLKRCEEELQKNGTFLEENMAARCGITEELRYDDEDDLDEFDVEWQ